MIVLADARTSLHQDTMTPQCLDCAWGETYPVFIIFNLFGKTDVSGFQWLE